MKTLSVRNETRPSATNVGEIDAIPPPFLGCRGDGDDLAQVPNPESFFHRRGEITDIECRFGARGRSQEPIVAVRIVCLAAFDAIVRDHRLRVSRIGGQKKSDPVLVGINRRFDDWRVVISLARGVGRSVLVARLGRPHARQEAIVVPGHRLFRQAVTVVIPITIVGGAGVHRRIDVAAGADARRTDHFQALGIKQLDQAKAVRRQPAAGQKGCVDGAQEAGIDLPAAGKGRRLGDVHRPGRHRIPPRPALQQDDPDPALGEARRRHGAAKTAADDDRVDDRVGLGHSFKPFADGSSCRYRE